MPGLPGMGGGAPDLDKVKAGALDRRVAKTKTGDKKDDGGEKKEPRKEIIGDKQGAKTIADFFRKR